MICQLMPTFVKTASCCNILIIQEILKYLPVFLFFSANFSQLFKKVDSPKRLILVAMERFMPVLPTINSKCLYRENKIFIRIKKFFFFYRKLVGKKLAKLADLCNPFKLLKIVSTSRKHFCQNTANSWQKLAAITSPAIETLPK